jgi:single-strand DNA-binding protein
MNLTILSGRLTKDPELTTAGDFTKCDFSLAVNAGKEKAEFISCIAWGKTAENLCRYQKKGSQVLIRGNLVTNNYTDKNDVKHYGMKVNADMIEFLGSRSDREDGTEEVNPPKNDYAAAVKKGAEETKAMFEKQNDGKKLDKLFEETSHICSDDLPF